MRVRRTQATARTTRRALTTTAGSVSAAVLFFLVACARIEPPPGGPPDAEPPQLLATYPDSLVVLPTFDDEVEFRFDEVVSEGATPSRGLGTGDLEKLVMLSPSTEVPEVRWRRSRITVRPADGWQRGRVYRVQLLPGLTDLRNNRTADTATITFTTGAPIPDRTLRGRAIDWSTGRPAAAALVEAILFPDSLPYRAVADSSGRFVLGPLPDGEYVVYGVLDQNTNRRRDPREAFDSTRLAAGESDVGELWAFVHDTTPPRIRTVTMADSMSANVELTQPLDPTQRLDPEAARVLLLPDSTPVEVRSVHLRTVDDSLMGRARAPDTAAAAPPDTVRAAPPDTIGRAAPPDTLRPREPAALAGRPPLTDRLVLRVAEPWRPGARYAVEIQGVRNVTGVTGDVRGGLIVPEKPVTPPDTLGVPVLPDSLVPDTLAPPPGDSAPRP